MRILFIHPDFPETKSDDNIFPFGYASLSSVLIKNGHKVDILFPNASNLTFQDVCQKVKESDAEVVAIGGLFPYLPITGKVVSMIKTLRPDAKVVLGGPMVTYTPELVFRKTGADFCIVGEGEIPLSKLVSCLENNTDYSHIKGLVFRRDGEIINNGWGELMPLEDIPMPNWEKFPMEYYMYSPWYLPSWSRTKQKKVMSWLISRGCPMKCNFCASGCAPRYKKMDQVMAELREISDRFDPTYLLFVDNFLMKNKKYSREFCEGLIKQNFQFKYSMTGRVNIVDREILKLFKESGCEIMFYGLECANNEILKLMRKGITVEQTIEAIKLTKEAGIFPMISIMFGQPGETLEDFANSIKIALMTSDRYMPYPNIASVMPLLTFPGTEIYQYALKNGYIKDEDDYYNKFFKNNGIINYTKYSTETIKRAVDVGNILYRSRYHYSMLLNLQDTLKTRLALPLIKIDLENKRWLLAVKKFLGHKLLLKQVIIFLLNYMPGIKQIIARFLGNKELKALPQTDEQREFDKFVNQISEFYKF